MGNVLNSTNIYKNCLGRNAVEQNEEQGGLGYLQSRVEIHRCEAPALFNKEFGRFFSATACPQDELFSSSICTTPDIGCFSVNFSQFIRHIATQDDLRSSAVILLFCRAGDVDLRVGGKIIPLDVALIRAGTDFTIRAREQGAAASVGWIVLRNSTDIADRVSHALLVPKKIAEGVKNSAAWILKTAGGVALEQMSFHWSYHKSGIAQLFSLIKNQLDNGQWTSNLEGSQEASQGGRTLGIGAGNRDIIATVEQYLRQNAHNPEITPTRIARHCAVSVRKLYNVFSQAGMSLHGVVLSYRLGEARRQLQDADVKKVTAIAFDVGFKDISTFYRNFRREFGYSPRGAIDAPAVKGRAALNRRIQQELSATVQLKIVRQLRGREPSPATQYNFNIGQEKIRHVSRVM